MRIGAGQLKALASCAGTHNIGGRFHWQCQINQKMWHALAAQGSSKLMGKSFRFHSPAGGGVTIGGGKHVGSGGRREKGSACGVVWCGVAWCCVVWCGVVLRGVVWLWCGVAWCGAAWCGEVWCECKSKPNKHHLHTTVW